METTLGGERLGSGKKQDIHMKDYNRSTHDLSFINRTTMSAGTLVPFMAEISLPGDSFEINLECDVLTHPTIGPLFGSYKVQLDVFTVPIRLYNAALHMNMLNIGLNMKEIYLPQMEIVGKSYDVGDDIDNVQINASSIMSHLDIRTLGNNTDTTTHFVNRQFNAVKWLAYWDIYKNYYANKQEGIGVVIHNDLSPYTWTIDEVLYKASAGALYTAVENVENNTPYSTYMGADSVLRIMIATGTVEDINDMDNILLYYGGADGKYYKKPITELFTNVNYTQLSGFVECTGLNIDGNYGFVLIGGYQLLTADNWQGRPALKQFQLKDIDDMRLILLRSDIDVPVLLQYQITPIPELYQMTLKYTNDGTPAVIKNSLRSAQEGLGCKTYQSDLFNNWLDTEWIDGSGGTGGINNITKVSITDDAFTINELLMAKKIYDMLNRIAVSGGSYDDWLDATYTQERIKSVENPIYMGGLSKELVFQEVISNSATENEPLGTLAGRGRLNGKNKGGYVKIKTDEPSYIIGIVSLTPRIDYSQGNKWDGNLKTMDDFHKPALDGIGFQNLQLDAMAGWTSTGFADDFTSPSAGKQPAWINYMTNVNKVRGNFAVATDQMYMTLNRKYEYKFTNTHKVEMTDLTTYIDPSKFNHIFADTRLDAQNFWVQIKADITARRKMSAKIIPNL